MTHEPNSLGRRSDPAASDCTQAYDQRELSRLLQATDATSGSHLGKPERSRSSSEIPTVRPPMAARDGAASVTIRSRGAIAKNDTAPDQEDLTTAYVRPSTVMLAGAPDQSPSGAERVGHAYDRVAANQAYAPLKAERVSWSPLLIPSDADASASEATGPEHVRSHPTQLPPARKVFAGAKLTWAVVLVLGLSAAVVAGTFSNRLSDGSARELAAGQWARLHRAATRTRQSLFPLRATETAADRSRLASAARLIDLDIIVEPREAQLFIDGRRASNPLRVAYPADGATHELRAEAPGYQAKTQLIRYDRDVSVMLGLGSLPPGPASIRSERDAVRENQ